MDITALIKIITNKKGSRSEQDDTQIHIKDTFSIP